MNTSSPGRARGPRLKRRVTCGEESANLLARLEAAAKACRAGQACEGEHGPLLRRFLNLSLEDKVAGMGVWLAGRIRPFAGSSTRAQAEQLGRLLAPSCVPPTERDGLVSDVRTALEVLVHQGGAPARAFSARERELLALLGQGLSSKQIAARLGVSVHTVSNHRRRIREKTGVSGAALVAWAAKSAGAGSEND